MAKKTSKATSKTTSKMKSSPKPTPKPEKAAHVASESPPEHSKTKLLKAAFQVFSDNGFHGTTTKMIASVAQVNEALITRHFNSKEGLFLAVVDEQVHCGVNRLTYPPQETLEKELLCYVDAMFNKDPNHTAFMRIVIGHSMLNPDFAKKMSEHLTPETSPLRERLKKLQEKGGIPKSTDIRSLEMIIAQQAFGAMFFSKIIFVSDPKASLQALREFASAVADAIKTQK